MVDQIHNFSFDELLVVIWGACGSMQDGCSSRTFQVVFEWMAFGSFGGGIWQEDMEDYAVQMLFQNELADRLAKFDARLPREAVDVYPR